MVDFRRNTLQMAVGQSKRSADPQPGSSVMFEKEMDRLSYAHPSTARHGAGQRIEESTLMDVPLRPLLCSAHY